MRRLFFLLAAVAASLAVADYLAWRGSQRFLGAAARESGLLGAMPEMATRLRRETEPARAATLAAWGLLDLEVDRAWLAELPEAKRGEQERMGLERLRLARSLALEVLPRRPSSWQAAMVLGATRYLESERTGERQQPSSDWRRPLFTAMELAPAHPEPALFLASASLSRWSSLSAEERQATRPALTLALGEPAGLQLLLPAWVRLAPSLSSLLEVIPDQPKAWLSLSRIFRAAGDLERFCIAHQRWLKAETEYIADLSTQVSERRRGGDVRSAFAFARRVMGTPTDLDFAVSVSRVLTELPEDVEDYRLRHDLRRWLLWALDLCVLGDCPFTGPEIARLTDLADELNPAQAELAELVAGAPAGGEADLPALARMRREIERPARPVWAAGNWTPRDELHHLMLVSPAPYRQLRVELAGVPAGGAAVELRWDGRILGAAFVQPGEDLVWRLTVEPGLHLVEISRLTARGVRPGALTLE